MEQEQRRDRRSWGPRFAQKERRCRTCGVVFLKPGEPSVKYLDCLECRPQRKFLSPEKYLAYRMMKSATGPTYCQKCAVDCYSQPHHFNGYDGNNACKVIWLCRNCHSIEHRKVKE